MYKIKSPFTYFGGKSKISDIVWQALGDVDVYIEPFAGSAAVLLARPTKPKLEIINDTDAYIANFWRAVKSNPDEVAQWANWPSNECDLVARHLWLVNTGRKRLLGLQGDPDYYDAKVAGWWVWGASVWWGGKWCSGSGPWVSNGGMLQHKEDEDVETPGVTMRRPGITFVGINRKRLHSATSLNGIDTGKDVILSYMRQIAERLRYVVVMCGDWSRVLTKPILTNGKTVGIFLDPPYAAQRNMRYNHDGFNISKEVEDWCKANQDNPNYRIVLAGYDGEHDLPGWRVISWKAGRSFGTGRRNSLNGINRLKERLWISPHCVLGKRLIDDV